MMDLISRDDALAVARYSKNPVEGIENLPAVDAVEVVRCKDCKHYKTDTDYCKEHHKGYCEWDNTVKSQKHFCSYGEKRDAE